MMHQPAGVVRGQASDIELQARELLRWKTTINETISRHTGQPIERVARDVERDYIMTATEALEYGLVDEVIDVRLGDNAASGRG
jgi:ATP-dependent Clp protease protease subunit